MALWKLRNELILYYRGNIFDDITVSYTCYITAGGYLTCTFAQLGIELSQYYPSYYIRPSRPPFAILPFLT